ncbi:MAG: substrate-binding domain-containing protein [Gammaproteobacteria bacterium]
MQRRSLVIGSALSASGLAGWCATYGAMAGSRGPELPEQDVCVSRPVESRPVGTRLPEDLSFAGTRLFKEGFLDELAQAYTRHTDRRVHVLGGGCDDGIAAVRGMMAHVGGLCCPVHGSGAQGLDHLIVGHDVKAVLAHPSVPIDDLRWDDLRQLVAGRITSWSQLGGPERPIPLVVHDHCPDYIEPARDLLLKNRPEWSRRALFAKTDQKHLDLLMRFDLSIGVNSWILAEPLVAAGKLKRLTIDGVQPGIDSVRSRRYRLTGPMNMIFREWDAELMAPFFAFLYSEVGQKILSRRMVPVSASVAGFPRLLRA